MTSERSGMTVIERLMGHGGVYDELGQVATMLGTGHADQKHCGLRIDAVRDAVEAIDRQHQGAVDALLAAPMPEIESTLKGEEWAERYGEWWHEHVRPHVVGGQS